MVTEKELSILSLHTYRVDVQRINEPLQGSWTILKNRTEGSGGFAYAVFQKGSEIVIAFRGSDETADYIGNLGLTTTQERQAAMVAAQFINQYGATNVSFTGHSLGGGLAATMAVWFNRPAIVFDHAPTQGVATDVAVVNSIIGTLGALAPQSIKDYRNAVATQFALRESQVTRYYAQGSPVHNITNAGNTIIGTGLDNSIEFGFQNLTGVKGNINRHSQALLTAGLLAPNTFPQA